eukprot:s819_g32.t1
MLSLFIRSFEMTDGECQLLQAVFNEVLEEKGASSAAVNLGSRGEPGLDFLGFMLVMQLDLVGVSPHVRAVSLKWAWAVPPRSPTEDESSQIVIAKSLLREGSWCAIVAKPPMSETRRAALLAACVLSREGSCEDLFCVKDEQEHG